MDSTNGKKASSWMSATAMLETAYVQKHAAENPLYKGEPVTLLLSIQYHLWRQTAEVCRRLDLITEALEGLKEELKKR